MRLDAEDALLCLTTPHVLPLGRLAAAVRHELHGKVAFYNINRHINPTNICVYTYNCKFCSFAALPGEAHAWQMSHEEVYRRAAAHGGDEVTEFHIVGGVHPDLEMAWYEEMLRGLRERFPRAHLKAFTAVEIEWFARQEKLPVAAVLERLVAAGLGSLPGGGAEIFHPECARRSGRGRPAPRSGRDPPGRPPAGLKSNCTMLYGHVERPEHKVDHPLRLRALQTRPAASTPSSRSPTTRRTTSASATRRPADDLHVAASRLVLDNIPHLKAYWVMVTPKLAQIALSFGADDLDGTVVEETIYHMAGAETAQQLTRAELERIVRAAGFEPVERDTLYRPVHRAA